MYRRIAVPLDGTISSQQAIPWALTIAHAADCPVDLIHVTLSSVTETHLYGVSLLNSNVDEVRKIAHRQLKSLADEITETGVPATPIVLEGGEIRETLITQLRKSGTDLVVMATRDVGPVERLMLGSVTASVVRHVHSPVLVIRADDDRAVSPNAARAIRHILVPLDGSAFGDAILPHVRRLASLLHSEVTLFAALQPVMTAAAMATDVGAPNVIAMRVGAHDDEPGAAQSAARRESLERAGEPLRASGLAVHTAVLVDDHPARAIVDYANSHGADAIAMTTHGRGALKRMVMGSVSLYVLRSSGLPMLISRPDGV